MAEFEIKGEKIIVAEPGSVHEIPLEGEAGQQFIKELVKIGTKSRKEVLIILSENGPIEF